MTLYDPSTGTNLIDDLVYVPTSTATDVVSAVLSLSATDGTAITAYTVTINEVPPNRLPESSAEVGDGSSPLTSGNDQQTTLTLTQTLVDGISANLAGATIKVYTDFQKTPFPSSGTIVPVGERNPGTFNDGSAGSEREQEVQVELWSGANKFAIVQDDLTIGTFEQSWFYDAGKDLMAATVNYTNIYLLDGAGVQTATTLASFLATNPAAAGNIWTLNYFDNDGGSFQARKVSFEFFYNDPGDPGIVVVGNNTQDNLIYGTSGNDNLTGGALDDIIIGRGGNDAINGGAGNDILNGGAGNDIIEGGTGNDLLDLSDATAGVSFTLVQSATNTTLNLSAVGLGTDTYRNIEGVLGTDHNDTLSGTIGADIIGGGGGADTINLGTEGVVNSVDGVYFDASAFSGSDTINDFVVGATGDYVDLTELFTVDSAAGATLSDYARMMGSTLEVDTDGTAGAATWTAIANVTGAAPGTVNVLYDDNSNPSDQNGTV